MLLIPKNSKDLYCHLPKKFIRVIFFSFFILNLFFFNLHNIYATITYQSASTIKYSVGALIPYPASIASSDLLIVFIGMKPSSANSGSVYVPDGWTSITSLTGAGGYGTTLGADTGNTNIFSFYKVADGTETGNLLVSLNTTNSNWAQMYRISNSTADWSIAGTTGSDVTTGTAVSIAMSADPGVTAGDFILSAMVIPTDVTTPSQFSAEALTQTGVTFGTVTEISEPDTTQGNDSGGFVAYAPVSSGTSSAAPTLTATAGGTTTNVRGPGIFVRVRATGTITYQSAGTLAYYNINDTQGVLPLYPASISLGDLLVLFLGMKPDIANSGSVTTPTNWTSSTSLTGAGGYGTTLAADTGNTNIFSFYKVADGTETGYFETFLSATSIAWAQIYRLSNDSKAWTIAGTTGSDVTTGTAVSIAMSADPGVTAGDFILSAMVIPTDVTTPSQFSAEALTQTGVTFGTVTEISEPDTSNGLDVGGFVARAPVSSGTGSAAPTLSATAGGTTTNVRGPGIFVRVRETPPTFEQSAYRFYNNNNSTDVGSALAAQNTSASLAIADDPFRLRMLMHVGAGELHLSGQSFRLQFAEKSGTCDTSFSGETYADVTGSTVIAYNDNTTPADGDNLTANANDPTHSGHTIVNQDYEEANNFTNSVAIIPVGQDGKWDFSLKDNSAPAGTSYCFRIIKSDDSDIDTYSVIPEITTASATGITYDNSATTNGASSTITLSSFAVGSGYDKVLFVGISTYEPISASSVTFDGNNLTYVGGISNSTNARAELWQLINPSNVTANIVVTFPSTPTNGVVVGALSLRGVNQLSPTRGLTTNTGSSVTPSVTITTLNPDSWVFDVWGDKFHASPNTATSPQVERWNSNYSTKNDGGGSTQVAATAGNYTNSWTLQASRSWAILAVEINAVGAVAQTLSFSISDNSVGFSSLSSVAARYATGDTVGSSSETIAHTITASSSATSGYTITVQGDTLTSGANTITAIGGTSAASSPGSEQFGLRITASGGYGAVISPYNHASNYAYAANGSTADDIASDANGDDVSTIYSVYYLSNISSMTETGNYNATLTYTITASF